MKKTDLIGYNYAKDVVNGEIIANKWVKLECRRYIDRLDGKEEDIYFDYEDCEILYSLLAIINYSTGFYANKPVINHIVGFQSMVLENIFCLYYKETDEFNNRIPVIEECYLEIGRKSGKSFISALILLLSALMSEPFSQIAIGGKTRDISGLVFKAIKELIKSSPAIRNRFKINRTEIICKINETVINNLSGEADTINGKLLSCYVVDECSNMQDSSVVDALKLSQMSTKRRLAIYISTQYDNPVNVFNDLLDYHRKVLLGVIPARNTFGLLFELDEADDFKDEKNWAKASPLQMGFENGRDFLRQEYQKGLTIPSAMREFQIKILNMKLTKQKAENLVKYEDWKKGEMEELNFKGKNVVIGVDLSVSIDLSGLTIGYMENNCYYFKAVGFLGRDSLAERQEKYDYLLGEQRGECFLNQGRTVNYSFIKDYILSIEEKFGCKIKMMVFDSYNANLLAEELSEIMKIPVIFLKQTYSELDSPCKELQRSSMENRLYHLKSTLYDIHCVDTLVAQGKSGQVMPDKQTRRSNKYHIDLMSSTVFCCWGLQNLKNYVPVDFNARILSGDWSC